MTKKQKPDDKKPVQKPAPRVMSRRSSIKLGVLTLGVALPLITTLAPTEARAEGSSTG